MAIIVGVIVSLRSNRWLIVWTGLELTLISFIPLISSNSIKASERCIKYFIIQRIRSIIFLFRILILIIIINIKNLILTSIIIKIAIPPFHSWIITIIEGLNYNYIFILFTLIKIVPLIIIKKISLNLNIISILSLIVGSISGLNQFSIRKILGYSSIFNIGFLIYRINSNTILILYLINYSIVILILILLEKEKIYFINQIIFLNIKIKSKLILWVNIISLGGFPPITGFIIKIIVFEEVLKNKEIILYFLMISTSLLTIYFYINLSVNLIIIYNLTIKWKLKKTIKINSIILILRIIIFSISISIKF